MNCSRSETNTPLDGCHRQQPHGVTGSVSLGALSCTGLSRGKPLSAEPRVLGIEVDPTRDPVCLGCCSHSPSCGITGSICRTSCTSPGPAASQALPATTGQNSITTCVPNSPPYSKRPTTCYTSLGVCVNFSSLPPTLEGGPSIAQFTKLLKVSLCQFPKSLRGLPHTFWDVYVLPGHLRHLPPLV